MNFQQYVPATHHSVCANLQALDSLALAVTRYETISDTSLSLHEAMQELVDATAEISDQILSLRNDTESYLQSTRFVHEGVEDYCVGLPTTDSQVWRCARS